MDTAKNTTLLVCKDPKYKKPILALETNGQRMKLASFDSENTAKLFVRIIHEQAEKYAKEV